MVGGRRFHGQAARCGDKRRNPPGTDGRSPLHPAREGALGVTPTPGGRMSEEETPITVATKHFIHYFQG